MRVAAGLKFTSASYAEAIDALNRDLVTNSRKYMESWNLLIHLTTLRLFDTKLYDKVEF